MITLFSEKSELSALSFLANHVQHIGLIGPDHDLNALPGELYLNKTGMLSGPLQGIPVIEFDDLSDEKLSDANDEPEGRLWLVSHSQGEGLALKHLRETYPNHHFAGLGEALFPALVAKAPKELFRGLRRKAKCTCMSVVFAPPRSGSSFVSDVLGHVSQSSPREHLRNDVIEILASPYRFDRVVALRNFLRLITGPTGHASTKIITHFMQERITDAGDIRVIAKVFKDIEVKAIVLDRDDKVAQCISGYLAANRGVWHLQNDRDAEKIQQSDSVKYKFPSLLPRYLGYRHQSYMLAFAREIFPDHLALEYSTDVESGDVDALGSKLADFLGLTWTPDPNAKTRSKLANSENERLIQQFRSDYKELFGSEP